MKDLKEQSLATFDKILWPTWLALLSTMPEIQMPLMLAYWFFWVVMQYKQDDVNNFVKILQDNPWIFTKEIVKTKEFQDWFLVIFESYLKERSEEKRKNIKSILLWFTEIPKEEKEEFELEKILDILNKISLNEICILKQIKDNKIETLIKNTSTGSYSTYNISKHYNNIKYFESLWLINIDSSIESQTKEWMDWDWKEQISFPNGKFETDIYSNEEFELNSFWEKFIKYITQ